MKLKRSVLFLLVSLAVLGGLASASQARWWWGGASDLDGTFYARYPVLFGETGKILEVEKYLTIEATEARDLFVYNQCWRLADGGNWNHEQGGLVVTSPRRGRVKFSIVEAEEAPLEGSTGFFQGRMLHRNLLDINYHGLGRGIVFRMKPRRTQDAVDELSCPVD